VCHKWCHKREYGRAEYAKAHGVLATEPLGQSAAWQMREYVTVVERRQHLSLCLLVPVEPRTAAVQVPLRRRRGRHRSQVGR